MGLDTTHNAWHGPYSSFAKWRIWLASKIGLDLDTMVGFGGDVEWSDTLKAHPLYPLLNHSDCDGELSPSECKLIAEGLGVIIRDHSDESDKHFIGWCLEFRGVAILAASENAAIEFH